MRLIYLFVLPLAMLLTACHVTKFFQTGEVQSYLSITAQYIESELQILPSNSGLDSNLCISGEEVIFSFKFEDSDKILTIAVSKEQDYLVCRLGTKYVIELEFPKDKIDSWDHFDYQYYSRGGGAQNLALTFDCLSFETDTFRYIVFCESRAVGEDQYENSIGLVLFDKESIEKKGEADNTKIIMKGDFNSIIGFLDKLQDTKIKKSFG